MPVPARPRSRVSASARSQLSGSSRSKEVSRAPGARGRVVRESSMPPPSGPGAARSPALSARAGREVCCSTAARAGPADSRPASSAAAVATGSSGAVSLARAWTFLTTSPTKTSVLGTFCAQCRTGSQGGPVHTRGAERSRGKRRVSSTGRPQGSAPGRARSRHERLSPRRASPAPPSPVPQAAPRWRDPVRPSPSPRGSGSRAAGRPPPRRRSRPGHCPGGCRSR